MDTTIYRRSQPPRGPVCRLIAVGDIMLSGVVARHHPPGCEASRLFGEVVALLRSGDIVFGNLETPLCEGTPGHDLFRGDPRMSDTLGQAGFSVLSLANNHILDYGVEGLRQCAAAL